MKPRKFTFRIANFLIQILKLLGNLFWVGVVDLAADGATVVQPDQKALPQHDGERRFGVHFPVHFLNPTVAFWDEGGYLFAFIPGIKQTFSFCYKVHTKLVKV